MNRKLCLLWLVLCAGCVSASSGRVLVLQSYSIRADKAVNFYLTAGQRAAQRGANFDAITPAQWSSQVPAALAVASAIEGRAVGGDDVVSTDVCRVRLDDKEEMLLVLVRVRSGPEGAPGGGTGYLEIPLLTDGVPLAWEFASVRFLRPARYEVVEW